MSLFDLDEMDGMNEDMDNLQDLEEAAIIDERKPEVPVVVEQLVKVPAVDVDHQVEKKKEKDVNILALNDTKAGMEGLDVDKINAIINQTSKGSRFYEHKKIAKERLDKRIAEMKKQLASFTQSQIKSSEKRMTELGDEMEKGRDLSRVIVHVDMDMFFAAVEIRDDPSLKDVPMAVGGLSMLSTSNYVARRYGVRAAMPGFIAKKLCPHLRIVSSNYDKYSAVSAEVQEILKMYDENFSSMSLDEAYLDITDHLAERNLNSLEGPITPMDVVREMREKIELKTQLTASAGIAANGLLAKICGDKCKPNNQYHLEPEVCKIKEFIDSLPIRKVGGIGNVTEQLLKALDINTCADLWTKRGLINLLFSQLTTTFLLQVSLGIGSSFFSKESSESDRKSYSCERTFNGTSDTTILKEKCLDLCTSLENDLRSNDTYTKSVSIKIKTTNFDVKTRVKTLLDYTCDGQLIFNVAWSIFESYLNEYKSKGTKLVLRLLGVRVSNLKSKVELQENTNTKSNCDSSVSSVANVFKKQQRIDDLFKNPTTSTATLACPVCSQNFETYKNLQNHLELCLNSQTETDSCRLNDNDNCDPKPSTSTATNYNSTSTSTNSNYNSTNSNSTYTNVDVDTSESCKNPNNFSHCPVCNELITSNLDSVINSHIDECLNSGTLKEILKNDQIESRNNAFLVPTNSKKRSSTIDSSSNTSTVPETKRKKTIDSYFHKA